MTDIEVVALALVKAAREALPALEAAAKKTSYYHWNAVAAAVADYDRLQREKQAQEVPCNAQTVFGRCGRDAEHWIHIEGFDLWAPPRHRYAR